MNDWCLVFGEPIDTARSNNKTMENGNGNTLNAKISANKIFTHTLVFQVHKLFLF